MELNVRWFPRIVDKDVGISIQYFHRSFVLIFDPMGGGGGGGGWGGSQNKISLLVFFAFYAISNIFRITKTLGGGGGVF